MPSRDTRLQHRIGVSIVPQAIGGAFNGSGVDLAGAESATVLLNSGAATTPATVKVQESDDNSTFTDVADGDLLGGSGNAAGGLVQVPNGVARVAYVGQRRYIRVITTAGSAAQFTATVTLGHLRHAGGVPV